MQTAEIMTRFEPVLLDRRPDMVLVYGDVNSTVAAALVCAKLQVPVGHVEAGLRSFDRTMPEEINRLVTDQLADVLFTPSEDGDENLLREGVDPQKIHLVGNVMIDTLIRLLPAARQRRRATDDVFEAPVQRWSRCTGRRTSTIRRNARAAVPRARRRCAEDIRWSSRSIRARGSASSRSGRGRRPGRISARRSGRLPRLPRAADAAPPS